MLDQIEKEENLAIRAKLLKDYLKGEVQIIQLSLFLQKQLKESHSRSWKKFCKEIQSFVQKQFTFEDEAKEKSLKPIQSVSRRVKLPEGYRFMNTEQKISALETLHANDPEGLKQFLKSQARLVVMEDDPKVFHLMMEYLGKPVQSPIDDCSSIDSYKAIPRPLPRKPRFMRSLALMGVCTALLFYVVVTYRDYLPVMQSGTEKLLEKAIPSKPLQEKLGGLLGFLPISQKKNSPNQP